MHLLSSLVCLTTALAAVSAQLIPNEYIVVYKSGATVLTTSTHESWLRTHATNINGSRIDGDSFRGYNGTGIRGYAAAVTSAMAEEISKLPEVAYVEQNQHRGLRRLSRANIPMPTFYDYPTVAGEGSIVYVLDTGIRATHSEFGGRATYGRNFISGETDVDGNGHGTHCAVAGTTYGVAKKASIVSLKVLSSSGSGSTAGIVSAIQWVKSTAIANRRPCIVSMSLGGGPSSALDNAVNDISTTARCLVVVAAGNENQDACNVSPARATWAYTVGATSSVDAFASFSNWGGCVNINAPGVGILSSNTATNTISGTSMACPHVAGVAAYYNFQQDLRVDWIEIFHS
ncbi:peptidase S8/S53 domain-containing protein [Chytridium lagenaria]|nr:peptidase S8/S53 domain-containing protein [Chytridium lagenaria]